MVNFGDELHLDGLEWVLFWHDDVLQIRGEPQHDNDRQCAASIRDIPPHIYHPRMAFLLAHRRTL